MTGARHGRAPEGTRVRMRRLARWVLPLVLLAATASCAYYNTFYLARKYYLRATDGLPYEVDRDGTTQRANYTKSSEYCKKVLGIYPKSKWVDDAYLLWAGTYLGVDDPLKAVAMLEEFNERYPKSDLRPDATFFLGLAYRAARKHEQAVASFDDFLVQAPKHVLAPYAWYERSKALMSLQRYREAAESAGHVVDGWRKHPLTDRAIRQRAEARFQQGDYLAAQSDFHLLGTRALTDDERLSFLLREVDCLESGRDYEAARSLLRDARSHVPPPPPLPQVRAGSTTNPALQQQQQQYAFVRTPEQERYGRLTLRMGGVELLAGRVPQAVEYYDAVLADYPRSQLAAEAQFRVGFAYETGADDFRRARTEYAKVREQVGTSQFVQQAQERLDNLDRIEQYRTGGGADSLAHKAEARFLTAEHYLFNLKRPERALEEYRAIADSVPVPSVQARALNAQAWLLSRKLDRKAEADSLFWRVVNHYPGTEAQLAARDYLEAEGQTVPEKLIVMPKRAAAARTDTTLTAPPAGTPKLGRNGEATIGEPGAVRFGPGSNRPVVPSTPSQFRSSTLTDSLRQALARRDSVVQALRADSTVRDTSDRGSLMARLRARIGKGNGVEVAPDSAGPPDFSKVDSVSAARLRAPGASAKLPSAPRVTPIARPDTSRAAADSLKARTHADSLRAAHKPAKAKPASKAKPKPTTSDTTKGSPR